MRRCLRMIDPFANSVDVAITNDWNSTRSTPTVKTIVRGDTAPKESSTRLFGCAPLTSMGSEPCAALGAEVGLTEDPTENDAAVRAFVENFENESRGETEEIDVRQALQSKVLVFSRDDETIADVKNRLGFSNISAESIVQLNRDRYVGLTSRSRLEAGTLLLTCETVPTYAPITDIRCDCCLHWVSVDALKLSAKEVRRLARSKHSWYCSNCECQDTPGQELPAIDLDRALKSNALVRSEEDETLEKVIGRLGLEVSVKELLNFNRDRYHGLNRRSRLQAGTLLLTTAEVPVKGLVEDFAPNKKDTVENDNENTSLATEACAPICTRRDALRVLDGAFIGLHVEKQFSGYGSVLWNGLVLRRVNDNHSSRRDRVFYKVSWLANMRSVTKMSASSIIRAAVTKRSSRRSKAALSKRLGGARIALEYLRANEGEGTQ